MTININLGNLWEMLSAIGTISAVVLSLFLAYKSSQRKININSSYDVSFNRSPSLILSKNSFEQFTIMDIGYIYHFKKYSLKSLKFYITGEDGEYEISNVLPFNFSTRNTIHIVFYKKELIGLDSKKIKYYATDMEGNVYKTKKVKFINREII